MAELNSLPVDDPVVIETIEELEFGIRAENDGGKATWLECFSTRNQLWKRTINGMMLQFIQQLNGQNFYCMCPSTRPLNLDLTSSFSRLLRRHVLQERRHKVSLQPCAVVFTVLTLSCQPRPLLYPGDPWRYLRRRHDPRVVPHRGLGTS